MINNFADTLTETLLMSLVFDTEIKTFGICSQNVRLILRLLIYGLKD